MLLNKPLSLALAEQVWRLLEDAGATETEKLAALEIAMALVPVSGKRGTRFVEDELQAPVEPSQ